MTGVQTCALPICFGGLNECLPDAIVYYSGGVGFFSIVSFFSLENCADFVSICFLTSSKAC